MEGNLLVRGQMYEAGARATKGCHAAAPSRHRQAPPERAKRDGGAKEHGQDPASDEEEVGRAPLVKARGANTLGKDHANACHERRRQQAEDSPVHQVPQVELAGWVGVRDVEVRERKKRGRG